MSSETWDAIIIGGGPAGACAASFLARAGRRVLVMEKERFPRYHVGESLIPGCLRVFDAIGVRQEVEDAGFVVKKGVTFSWGIEGEWSISFEEQGAKPDYAFQVDRARFDEILLNHAERSGAEVRQEVAVTGVELMPSGAEVTSSSGVERARYVIDASGQGGVLGGRMGQRRFDESLRNVAVWQYFRGCPRQPGAKAGNISILRHGDGWWWFIPLGSGADGLTSVGVVMSRESYRALGANVEKAFEEARGAAPEVGGWLEGARPASELRGAADWSYWSERVTGDRWLLAGDAAGFVDPLLSTGCYLALSGGYLAGLCVSSVLDDPHLQAPAFAYYEASYGKIVAEVHQLVRVLYGAMEKKEVFDGAKSILKIDGDPRELFIRLAAGNVNRSASDGGYLGGENAMPSEVFGAHGETSVHYGVPFDPTDARVLSAVDPRHLPASVDQPMVLVEQNMRLRVEPASAFPEPGADDEPDRDADVEPSPEGPSECDSDDDGDVMPLASIRSDEDIQSLLVDRVPCERGASALLAFDVGPDLDPLVVGFSLASATEERWSTVGDVALYYLTDADAAEPYECPSARKLLDEVLSFARTCDGEAVSSPIALEESIRSRAGSAGWKIVARAARP